LKDEQMIELQVLDQLATQRDLAVVDELGQPVPFTWVDHCTIAVPARFADRVVIQYRPKPSPLH
jgi:hypothetical protein